MLETHCLIPPEARKRHKFTLEASGSGRFWQFPVTMKRVVLLIGLYICDNIMALDMVRRRKESRLLADRDGSRQRRRSPFHTGG
jgi:hypothetical protein